MKDLHTPTRPARLLACAVTLLVVEVATAATAATDGASPKPRVIATTDGESTTK